MRGTGRHKYRWKEARTIEHIQGNWELLEQFMELLAKQFGDRCEVVLHDLTRSYDNTIVAIKNGQV